MPVHMEDFLPTYLIVTYNEAIKEPQSFNNETLFDFYFYMQMDGKNSTIEAIGCNDYINGPYWANYTQEERDSATA